MGRLGNISGKEATKAFGKGTLRALIRAAGMTVEEFLALLEATVQPTR